MNTENKDETQSAAELENDTLSFADAQDSPESMVDSDQPQDQSLPEQLQNAEERAIRAQAELDNFRKRTRREMGEREKFASLNLMSDLLQAVDNLELAIQAAQSNSDDTSLLEGVQMVKGQLLATLGKFHCKKIEALGQLFDPNLHEAVQMQPNAETPADHVALEVRSGYMLHDRVIRPTQVFVSTGDPG